MKRRNFIRKTSVAGIGLSFIGAYACKEITKENNDEIKVLEATEPFFKLSLAQWSIHRMIREEGLDPYAFARKAKEWGFKGLEYVSQLYNPELSDAHMIDGQGNLAVSDETERNETVEKHKRWVDAAAAMGCHAIRVNLNGSTDPEEWKKNSVDGLTKLATYAKEKNINVIVENHGGLSSNGEMHAEVMKMVNMDNCGTLPDFGNFCITRKPDSRDCELAYDKYKGVKALMPYAKAVSAKSYNFDANGNEVDIDYVKMLQMVKDQGYKGFIGVEYEGNVLSEEEGIKATKALLLKAAKKVV